MDIISLYVDAADRTAVEQNGSMTIAQFNRFNKIASLRLMDWLSGDVAGLVPPEPYNNEKLRDWLTQYMKFENVQVINGSFNKPADYYKYDSAAVIGSYRDEVCGKDVLVSKGNTAIEILDGPQFDSRCGTYIESLQPSMQKPIGRMVGNTIETMPVDLGSVRLYYLRYPVHGEVKVKVDPVYNNEVPDPATSIDTDWPEYARNALLFFIVQQYPAATRENALQEQNTLINKSPRG